MLRASQAVAGEIDPLRVVNDAIENGVSVGGIADQLVPFVDWDLAGDDRRSPTVEQQSALLDQRTESRRQRQGGFFARLFRRRPTSKAMDALEPIIRTASPLHQDRNPPEWPADL